MVSLRKTGEVKREEILLESGFVAFSEIQSEIVFKHGLVRSFIPYLEKKV